MNKSKLLNAIGMAYSSGNIAYGAKMLENIKKGQIKLVIIAGDMGASQKKKISDKCKFYNVEFFDDIVTVDELSKAVGKEILVAVGINDYNFFKLFKTILEEK